MSRNPRPDNPDPRSEMAVARERAASPVVRHAARELPLLGETVDFSVPHMWPAASRSSSIVGQTREIIDFILDDPDPRSAEIRQRLRTWVDAYPGFPDRALLEHMIETCRQANAQRQPEDTPAPVAMHRAAPQ